MRTHIIEATNGEKNWGKFMVGQFDSEWEHTSAVDKGRRLLPARGWGAHMDYALVLDIETGEGAVFRLGGLASADLNKHKIWVCPLFEPFLTWLYAYRNDHADTWWDTLPPLVDLPDAPFELRGYRRTGGG